MTKRLITLFLTLSFILTHFAATAQHSSTAPNAPATTTTVPSNVDQEPASDRSLTDSFLNEEGPSDSRFMEQFIHMLLSLGFILVLIFVVAWVLKRLVNQRLQQQNSSSYVNVIERRTLSPKAAVYLIEVNNVTLVVGESPTGLHPLAQFPSSTIDKSNPGTSSSFGAIYDKTTEKKPS